VPPHCMKPRTRSGDASGPPRPRFPGKCPPVFPAASMRAYNPPSRRGYTARRCSEAGSALVVREGRKPSSRGRAENGLPPATRGKRQGIGRTLSFHTPNGAPDVPVRHTRGPGSGGCVGIVRRDDRSPEGEPFRPVRHGVRPDDKTGRPIPETGEGHRRPRLLQRDRSRGHKPLNGALKGATLNIL
jgi:hypothetical protein